MADVIGQEVTSSVQYADIDLAGRGVGDYEYEVRTYDGEFWSPWSTEKAVFDVPPTVSVFAAQAGADAPEPDLIPSVTVIAATAFADTGVQDYTNEVSLTGIPTATATTDSLTPFTSLLVVEDSYEYADLVQYEFIDSMAGTYQYQVRTYDGEFWSPWSDEYAQFEIPAIVGAVAAIANADAGQPDMLPGVQSVPMTAIADMTTDDYTNEVSLVGVPGVASSGAFVPWSWLEQYTSTDEFYDIVTDNEGHYDVSVRTFDGEFWGEWSTELAEYEVLDPGNISTFWEGAWRITPRRTRVGSTWVKNDSVLL